MGADVSGVPLADAGECLAGRIIDLMRRTGMPDGLASIGYTENELDGLVESTLAQQRIIAVSPRIPDTAAFRQLFVDSMRLW